MTMKSGIETTEYRLARLQAWLGLGVLVAGVCLAISAVFLLRTDVAAMGVLGFVATALVVVGGGLMAGALRHYAGARATSKAAAYSPPARIIGRGP